MFSSSRPEVGKKDWKLAGEHAGEKKVGTEYFNIHKFENLVSSG